MPSARLRRAVGVALLISVIAPVANAQALDPPALLYREGVSESEPLGPWLPLDGARIEGLGFILGTRAQAKPPTDSGVLYRLKALAVPDGHPDQGSAFDPASSCLSNASSPGSEVVLTTGRFEGPGTYTISLDADTPSNGATRTSCSGGASSTATFTDRSHRRSGPGRRPGAPDRRGAHPARDDRAHAGRRQRRLALRRATGRCGPTVTSRGSTSRPSTAPPWCAGRSRAAGTGRASRGRASRTPRRRTTSGPRAGRPRWPSTSSRPSRRCSTATDRRPPRYTVVMKELPQGSEGALVTLRITRGQRCPRMRAKRLRVRVDPRLEVALHVHAAPEGQGELPQPRRRRQLRLALPLLVRRHPARRPGPPHVRRLPEPQALHRRRPALLHGPPARVLHAHGLTSSARTSALASWRRTAPSRPRTRATARSAWPPARRRAGSSPRPCRRARRRTRRSTSPTRRTARAAPRR